MIEELREYKNIIEDVVNLLGYMLLRYVIFEGEKVNRIEY